ncbi:MAG TPA: hypothetical protein EYQ25_12095 [Planctomycetes bacterium]|nr:hypothetical protein [Planctomycetota bacterium]HIL37021.1 hypothetical protein [Planctomycetota bacterium]
MPCTKLLISLLLLASCGDARRPQRPARHVLLITVEGLRADHTSALMYHRSTTLLPVSAQQRAEGKALSIDDLAGDGVLFSQAFAPSGDGGQGVLSIFSGERGLDQPPRPMLAQSLADKGMFCVAFVNDSNQLPPGVEAGFHSCLRLESDLDVLIEAVRWFGVHDFGNCEGVFVWIHLAGPAFPFVPGAFSDPLTREPVDFAQLHIDRDSGAHMNGSAAEREAWWTRAGASLPPPADLERLLDLYDGGVSEMSYQLWFLLDYLQFVTRSDRALDESVLIVSGVNGVELDRPGIPWGSSSEPHDSSLHVPLLIRHTGGLKGQRILDPVVELCDLAPTLCEWFGLGFPSSREGRSLLPLLGQPFGVERHSAAETEQVFLPPASLGMGGNPPRLTVRDERWRLVVDLADSGSSPLALLPESARLFDSLRNPREERDLAAQHPEQVSRMLRLLSDLRSDPEPAPKESP